MWKNIIVKTHCRESQPQQTEIGTQGSSAHSITCRIITLSVKPCWRSRCGSYAVRSVLAEKSAWLIRIGDGKRWRTETDGGHRQHMSMQTSVRVLCPFKGTIYQNFGRYVYTCMKLAGSVTAILQCKGWRSSKSCCVMIACEVTKKYV